MLSSATLDFLNTSLTLTTCVVVVGLGATLLAALRLLRWFLHWPAHSIKKMHYQRASPFQPDLIPASPIDTIVIGSGSGGCACANLLAQSGQKVLLLEQHPDRTGGCTHSFRIDVSIERLGVHVNGMVDLFLNTMIHTLTVPPSKNRAASGTQVCLSISMFILLQPAYA